MLKVTHRQDEDQFVEMLLIVIWYIRDRELT